LLRFGEGAVLVDAAGEPPLVLVAGSRVPQFGRWADGAVAVLCGTGEAITASATALLEIARPRLIAVAADEPQIEIAIAALREHLGAAALVALEPGLALEV
jgi:hypothetical protein